MSLSVDKLEMKVTLSSNEFYLETSCLQVTGANRGLGFAIVKKLCETFEGVVILTGNINIKKSSRYMKNKEYELGPCVGNR